MTAAADCHLRRSGELMAALGAAPLAALMQDYAEALAKLTAEARAGLDAAPLAAGLHRLQGSGSTLGFDSTAAALAGAGALLQKAREADSGAEARDAIIAALAAAEACRARGWAALLAARPEMADHAEGASKR
jgi:hypothetical protein